MLLRKASSVSFAVLAMLFTVAAPAQEAQPKRPSLDVPYVPTTDEAVQAMLKLAGVKSADLVYDLGCGDGRIVIAAAKTYGAHGVGIDIDPQRIAEARKEAQAAGVESLVRFVEGDLFKADIRPATVVTLFLLNSVNLRLRPKLQQDLKPGTRIVSNTFDMGDWKADKELMIDSDDAGAFLSRHLYLWIIPPRAAK